MSEPGSQIALGRASNPLPSLRSPGHFLPWPPGRGALAAGSFSLVSALLTSGPLSLGFLLWILWLEDTQPESLSGRKWEKAVEGHP